MSNVIPKIKFGTDGWRAIMDTEYTMENLELVTQAFADLMNENHKKAGKAGSIRVVVGYDFRENSEVFAHRSAEILVANGIQVILSSAACPTPAVSYTIVDEKCDAGIAITASHNPARYNGFKIKNAIGSSAEKTITDAVESLLGKNPVKKTAFTPQNPVIRDINTKFIQNLKNYLRLETIKNSSYRILVDSMHGVGADTMEKILAGGKIKVQTIRGNRDITFGGVAPEPIAKYLAPSIELMKTGNYDLGVVTDGDADRVGAIRPGGEFVSPGIILSLILLHFVEDLKMAGGVVTTISNTGLIYRVARKLGVKVFETPVGFKYICEVMRKENILIGGEESGGIAFQNYMFERDGILSSLLLMQMMAMRAQSFEQILKSVEKEFGRFYYVRQDLTYPNELKVKLFEFLSSRAPKSFQGLAVERINAADGIKFVLKDDNWLLFRLSGTEPILRVYAEASSQALADALVNEGKQLAFSLK